MQDSLRFKMIPLSRLETDPKGTLSECLDSGEPVVVEMPDGRLVTLQSLESADDEDLVNELLRSNAAFRALVEQSKASPRRPFPGTP